MNEEPYITASISGPKELLDRARIRAAKADMTFSEYVRNLIRENLESKIKTREGVK